MEDERLLQNTKPELIRHARKNRICDNLSPTFLKLCALLLLPSIWLNFSLVWLHARPHLHSSMSSEYGQLMSYNNSCSLSDDATKPLASLSRHLTEPYYKKTPYSDSNNSIAASLWHGINIDDGVIALSDDYVTSKGLLPAQRFPWDATKGIYILHGYHNLHCLVGPPSLTPFTLRSAEFF